MRSDGTGRAAVVAALTEAAQNPAKPGSPRSVIPHLSKELGSFELVYTVLFLKAYRFVSLRLMGK